MLKKKKNLRKFSLNGIRFYIFFTHLYSKNVNIISFGETVEYLCAKNCQNSNRTPNNTPSILLQLTCFILIRDFEGSVKAKSKGSTLKCTPSVPL